MTGVTIIFVPQVSIANSSPSEKGTPERVLFMNMTVTAYSKYSAVLFAFIHKVIA